MATKGRVGRGRKGREGEEEEKEDDRKKVFEWVKVGEEEERGHEEAISRPLFFFFLFPAEVNQNG